jgi:hypothetical protein
VGKTSITTVLIVADVGDSAVCKAAAQVAMTNTNLAKVCLAGNSFGFDKMRALGLHLADGKCTGFTVARTDRIHDNSDFPASLKQTQGRSKNSIFSICPDQHKFPRPNLSQKPFYPRLIKRVRAALMKNNLVVILQDIMWQVGATVRGKDYPTFKQSIVNFPLAVSAVKTIVHCAGAVVIGVNLAGRYDRDIAVPGPGYHPSKVHQNPAMISNACFACTEKEVLLSADVYQHPFAT